MNRFTTCLVGSIASLCASFALAAAPASTELNFRVLLDGKPIGEHRFELRGDGDTQQVLSRATFKVRFLFLDVYSYHHTDTEHWRDGCLVSLESRTNDDGKLETVDARRAGDALLVDALRGKGAHAEDARREEKYEGCVRSFAYWNPKLLESSHLLNSQTGEYLPVRFESLGKDRISIDGNDETTERYRLSGKDLDIDLWYTADSRWVALESRVDGGRILRYERN